MAVVPFAAGCGAASVPDVPQDPGLVSLGGMLGNTFVPAGEASEIVAQIRVGTSPGGGSIRPPINVALVLDTSGSMEGEPIEDAREAALAMLDALGEEDRLSVVAFHSEAEVLLPSTRIGDAEISELREHIGRMEARGTTDMQGGMQAGLEQVMTHFQSDGINRLVVLGDGVPNDAANILALAQAAGERQITITALGLGLDYDETLMGQVAQLSGGRFHYIEESSQVATVFRDEVLRMQQVFGRNAIVRIQPGPGVQIVRVVGQSVSQSGGAVQVALGDLTQGELRDLFVQAQVEGRRDGASVELLDIRLEFDDAVAGAGRLEREVFLGARATADAGELAGGENPEVQRAAQRVNAAAVTVDAIRTARAGDIEGARTILREAEARAQAYATTAQDDEVASDAANLRRLEQALPSLAPTASAAEAPAPTGPSPATSFSDDPAPAAGAGSTSTAPRSPANSADYVRQSHDAAMNRLGY
jgi:Ca-activated chloride channel family protein